MSQHVFEVRITLKHVKPPVWRLVLVDPDIRLDMLHEVIQAAMGWEDAHLHSYHSKGKTYMAAELENGFAPSADEAEYTLRELAPNVGDHIEYEYDFGDGWQHEVKVTGVVDHVARMQVPSIVDGENACPPEDCGGISGFADMLKAFFDEHHPDHDEVVDSIGEEYDPEVFDIDAANERLALIE